MICYIAFYYCRVDIVENKHERAFWVLRRWHCCNKWNYIDAENSTCQHYSVILAQLCHTKTTAEYNSPPVSRWLIHVWLPLYWLMYWQHLNLDVGAVLSFLKCSFCCVRHLPEQIWTLDLRVVNASYKFLYWSDEYDQLHIHNLTCLKPCDVSRASISCLM